MAARSKALVAGLLALLMVAGIAVLTSTSAAAERENLKVSIANVGSTRTPPVGPILETQKPHIMVISEAYHAREHLTAVAERQGYILRQYGREQGAEAPGIALLIRKDVTLNDRVLLKMSEPWWWPNPSKEREPRRYPAVDLTVSGERWLVVGVHFPPGGPDGGGMVDGKNRAAWLESKQAVQAYAANHPNPPVVAAGDFNALASECRHHFPGFAVSEGGKVDHAMTKEGRGARFESVSRHDAPVGHGWFTFRLSAAS
ncbi:hypothetical protein EV193_101279 [Herbihabitans rhizosphaerae]|uniref:Endonuclease/exonuclease/phosphatase domain-containing protein n=1 Tax=Herbihabitans rhizosphaerae TaxID=1872711 RepID=A0A4V2EUF6_9PSEU|nr:endonuclease/exonuclease/phosphatase family protein [Herbihabitans rhizosphaerae]RZS44403.1 hypothetical protein EV193_101279 [Herbihabitans rhizosphaerae]